MCVYWWFIYPAQRGLSRSPKTNWNDSRKTPHSGYKGIKPKRSISSHTWCDGIPCFQVDRKGIKDIQKNETLLKMQKHQPCIFRIKEIVQICMLQGYTQYQEPIWKCQITSLKYIESIAVTWLLKNHTKKNHLIYRA